MPEKKSQNKKIIIFSAIFLLAGGIIGYLIGSNTGRINNPGDFDSSGKDFSGMGNFQIDETAIAEVTAIFESGTTSEIETYCQENRMNCAYYCMQVDSENEICSILNAPGATK